ncbi:MAG: alpha/beta hydrolase [Bacteriovoracaceae bacterium]
MKNLQDSVEERWTFNSFAQMDGVIKVPENPSQIILLLHGYDERGKRIFRKLIPYLPENALVIAPNGPFPLPRPKEDRLDFGFAWYFYDRFKKDYYINHDLPKNWLTQILKQKNPHHLPVTIIGFSQGGYLAPLVGLEIPETRLVIGIGCEFRSSLIESKFTFPLEGIHGKQDSIIQFEWAENEIKKLQQRGINSNLSLVDAGHEINKNAGEKVKEILEKYGK